MRTKILFLSFLLFSLTDLHAQEDSVQSDLDTGKLFEQSSDDSPILDVIGSEPLEGQTKPAVYLRSRITQTLQRSVGFTEGTYLGSSIRSYHRITARQGKRISGGVLISKDAGEQRLNDFTSWNIDVSNIGILHKAVAGDYRVEAGQGVALWRGYDFSKGAEVVAPLKRKRRGLISSLSTDEVAYFSGSAAEVQIGSFSGIAFYSRRILSASYDTLANVVSLYPSGYFRTANELSRRDNLTQKLLGVHSSFSFDGRCEFGFTYYRTKFTAPLLLDEGRRFSGDSYSLSALDYDLTYQSMTLFGEWAKTTSAIGGITGLLLNPAEDITLIASLRLYPFGFISMHGLGFGERNSTSNEHGFYLGMKLRLTQDVSLSSYYDRFTFPGATSISKFPTGGNDILLEVEYGPVQKLTASFRYQRKMTDEHGTLPGVSIDRELQQRVRLQIDYHLSPRVKLSGRAERVFLAWNYFTGKEKGLMLYDDISVLSGRHFRWNARVVFFQTDSYNSRIYEYERDLEGVVANPPLYGTGIRWYGVVRYEFADHFELSAKYSDIIRDDVKHLGSGLDELPANHDNRISVQLDVRL